MDTLKPLLELTALILSILNALILVQNHLRDKPSLKVSVIYPDAYQWWFELPGREYGGLLTRRYGFLAYIGVSNRGLRKVNLTEWRLFIKTHAQRKKQELIPLSINEPTLELDGITKYFPVLGTQGPVMSTGDTTIDSGGSITGWAYFHAEYYGEDTWKPVIKNGEIKGDFVVHDVFGGKTKAKIVFRRKELAFIEKILPAIEKIV